ncbi:DUF269 domain-containing protein [Azotobacter vinelandii]
MRDVHRFGFESLEALVAEANKQLGKAATLVNEHRTVAEL